MTISRNYQRGVAEIFGFPPEASSSEAKRAREEYRCPFLGATCPKRSQHRGFDPGIPLGACSVWHRGIGLEEPQPYVICPVRFLQEQRIFYDASSLLKVRDGEEIMVIPELVLALGRIDYVLVANEPTTQSINDFVILEAMACSTTTTGDVLQSFHDLLKDARLPEDSGTGSISGKWSAE